MTKKTYNKWLARILDKRTPWTEQDIIFFRKAVKEVSLEADRLRIKFEQKCPIKGYHITAEQTEKGLNYIRKLAFSSNGKLRHTKDNPFNDREAAIIADFYEFRFVGLAQMPPYYGSFYFTAPIYRVVGNNGKSFEYLGVHKSMIETFKTSHGKAA